MTEDYFEALKAGENFVIDKVKVTQVTFEEFSEYTFIPPSTFYIMDARQMYLFFSTSKRDVAQRVVDEIYGEGVYTVKASKLQKTKSKLESGGLSCTGTNTRRGFMKK